MEASLVDRIPQGTGECKDCHAHVETYEYNRHTFTPPLCPACRGKANEAEDERLRRARPLLPVQVLRPKFTGFTFEGFHPDGNRRVLDVCRVYADSFPHPDGAGLALQGGVGLGKTHLAVAVARRVPGSYVINAVELLDELRRSFAPGAVPTKVYDVCLQTPLLVLDDMGKQKPTEWAAERLYYLMNYRTEYRLPVIVTTNDQPSLWDSRWTEAVADRVRGMCELVTMRGLSHRRVER